MPIYDVPAIQAFYENHIAQAETELYAVFDPGGQGGNLEVANYWQEMPLGVLEAWAFYKLYVMDQDWGSVGVYPVYANGFATVAVWTHDDGGGCWLEVYGAEDGAFIASARSANGKVAWRARDMIRPDVFGGNLPQALLTPEQAAFYAAQQAAN